jgi:hypothetical protein
VALTNSRLNDNIDTRAIILEAKKKPARFQNYKPISTYMKKIKEEKEENGIFLFCLL